MNVIDRFLKYVSVNSRSVEGSEESPTSPGQLELAKMVAAELMQIVPRAKITIANNGVLVCQIPAAPGFKKAPHVCLSAHFDTYYEQSGDVFPIIHNYRGGDIALPKNNVVISVSENPDLASFTNSQIITADGTSILGADNKAGLAGIVTAVELLFQQKQPHGRITLLFFPDEEIGKFDGNILPANLVKDWAVFWTIDGLEVGTIDQECFIGIETTITFTGVNVHPGIAGQKLVPAHYAACALVHLLAQKPTPWQTSGREPFHYAVNITGNASEAKVVCIPRAFEPEVSKKFQREVKRMAAKAAEFYPGVSFKVNTKELSGSTLPAIQKHSWVIEPAKKALEAYGFKPVLRAIRGGTDGAMVNLVYPDLPAPNMGCGARNVHELREWIPVKELEVLPLILVDMLINYTIIRIE
jgi:tripeptide aminopeptidase